MPPMVITISAFMVYSVPIVGLMLMNELISTPATPARTPPTAKA